MEKDETVTTEQAEQAAPAPTVAQVVATAPVKKPRAPRKKKESGAADTEQEPAAPSVASIPDEKVVAEERQSIPTTQVVEQPTKVLQEPVPLDTPKVAVPIAKAPNAIKKEEKITLLAQMRQQFQAKFKDLKRSHWEQRFK